MLSSIKQLVSTNKIIVFMKGSKLTPLCGFSNTVIQILNNLGVEYETYDVLENFEMRQAIKDYSNWPTLPQLYINEEFIGGADIVFDLYEKGELRSMVEFALAS